MEKSVANESKGHLSGILFFFAEIADRQKASISESLFGGGNTTVSCVSTVGQSLTKD